MSPWLLLSYFLLATQPAAAYIEPGNGGMMVQLLVAGFAGFWVWMRLYWARFVSMFRRKPEKKEVAP